MGNVTILEREMTDAEFAREGEGFGAHAIEHGYVHESERFGFVATDGENFVGCSSGLAYKNAERYSNWFYITDLFVEKAYRGRGLGFQLMQKLEDRVQSYGIENIWTWTGSAQAPDFYQKLGYEAFCEMDDWYASGHSRIGLRKILANTHLDRDTL